MAKGQSLTLRGERAPLVSIIIVNWNGKEYLKKCFDSLQKQVYENFEIILVDNGSSDGSVEFVEKYYPDIKKIRKTRNLGFAEGNNIGYKHSKGEYILFLNSDTEVEPAFLSELIKVMESDDKIGSCQGKIFLTNPNGILDLTGSFLSRTGFLIHEGFLEEDKGQFDEIHYIFSAKGACMLFRRSTLEHVGLFDKDFFAYFEEADLCWRTWLAGYKIIFVPKSKIFHKLGATAAYLNSAFIDYHSFKNRICSLLKNLEIRSLIQILSVHIFICLGVSMIYIIKTRFHNALAIYKAIFWNLVNLRNTLRKRRHIQKDIRVFADKALFPIIMKKASPKFFYKLVVTYLGRV